jgi:hypothetical protein
MKRETRGGMYLGTRRGGKAATAKLSRTQITDGPAQNEDIEKQY